MKRGLLHSTTVLIADSQKMASSALSLALGKEPGFQVLDERPTSGRVTIDVALDKEPQIALLDYWLEDMNGPAAAARIHAALTDCKILLYSWIPGPNQVTQALEAGAVGFLPQSVGIDDLAEAIRQAAAGAPVVFGAELQRMLESIGKDEEEVARWKLRLKDLTSREIEILQALGSGSSVQEISDALFIAQATIRWHIQRILRKTNCRSQAEVLAIARYCGVIKV